MQPDVPLLYSVDASSLIDVDTYYPSELFPSLWERLGDLAASGRLLSCEGVKNECRDDALQEFFEQHPEVVTPMSDFEDHFRALMRIAQAEGILVDYSSTKEEADPYVIALALKLDGRDPGDLEVKASDEQSCVVVAEEKRNRRLGMRRACARLRMPLLPLLDMLRQENYKA